MSIDQSASPVSSAASAGTKLANWATNGIPALRGKFIFGDIVRGRLFVADLAAMKKADDGIPQTVPDHVETNQTLSSSLAHPILVE